MSCQLGLNSGQTSKLIISPKIQKKPPREFKDHIDIASQGNMIYEKIKGLKFLFEGMYLRP